MAYLFDGFFELGLKTISPDAQTFRVKQKITTIRLTSDSSFDEIFNDLEFVIGVSAKGGLPEIGNISVKKLSKGVYEFEEYITGNVYIIISAKNKETQKYSSLIYFESYIPN